MTTINNVKRKMGWIKIIMGIILTIIAIIFPERFSTTSGFGGFGDTGNIALEENLNIFQKTIRQDLRLIFETIIILFSALFMIKGIENIYESKSISEEKN